MGQMIFALSVFVITYIWLATEKTPRPLVVLFGCGCLIAGRTFTLREALQQVQWNVILMLLAVFVVAEVLSEVGIFHWMALSLARVLEFHPLALFFALPLAAGCLSMVMNNIAIMVFMTGLTLQICHYVPLRPIPLIVGEACCSNMAGAATLLGATPNLIIATMLHLSFIRVAVHMAPLVWICTGVFMAIYYLQHRRELLRMQPTDGDKLSSPPLSGLISLRGLKDLRFLKKVDYQTLLFFIGLFIIMGSLERTGVFQKLAETVGSIRQPALLLLGTLWLSAFASAFGHRGEGGGGSGMKGG